MKIKLPTQAYARQLAIIAICLLTYSINGQVLNSLSFTCIPPPVQTLSFYNPELGTWSYHDLPVKIHEIAILYNYEIHHASGVTWARNEDIKEEDKGWLQSAKDEAGSWFGNIFGNDEEEEEVTPSMAPLLGNEHLLKLEQHMTEELWNSLQVDNSMTFDGNGTCAGLVIDEEAIVGARILQQTASTQLISDEDAVEGKETTEYATTGPTGADSAGTSEETQLENAFEGTELLGLSSEPYDQVSVEGCARAADTCTAIKGQVSAAYAGTNEYGVVKIVIERIQGGIEDGSFKDYPDSVALDLSFLGGGDTAQVGIGTSIQMSTARGTTVPEEPEDESNYISEYGKMFVSFCVILGVGCIVTIVIKRRRRKRREKEMHETDEEDSFAEDVEGNTEGNDIKKTAERDSSSSSPPPQNQETIQTAEEDSSSLSQECIPVNISSPNNLSLVASASDEVEISLSPGSVN